jgi:hypothetical protein
MFDQNNLYFGIYAYDSQPDQVIVRSMSRDGEVTTGDNIQIALDPGLTRRNSYAFIIGPSGRPLGRIAARTISKSCRNGTPSGRRVHGAC